MGQRAVGRKRIATDCHHRRIMEEQEEQEEEVEREVEEQVRGEGCRERGLITE